MILANARFDLTAPALVRWMVARFAIYMAAAGITAIVFVAGAAFYSFVWPSPPPQVLTQPPEPIPPTIPPSRDQGDVMKRIFSPHPVDTLVVSDLSLRQVLRAKVIVLDGDTRRGVGTAAEAFPIEGKDFALKIRPEPGMSNEFGFRTPREFTMRASDLSWYSVRLSGAIDIYAVATNEQVVAAMARAIR